MMHNDYLNHVIRRGNELAELERAASSFQVKSSLVRWIVAAAFGLMLSLIPSVSSAQAFFQRI